MTERSGFFDILGFCESSIRVYYYGLPNRGCQFDSGLSLIDCVLPECRITIDGMEEHPINFGYSTGTESRSSKKETGGIRHLKSDSVATE